MDPKYGKIGAPILLVCSIILVVIGPLVWKIVGALFLISLAGAAYRWWTSPRRVKR